MAIGWLTVLKMVPWGDVIENAPKVAQGAKKLWSSVGKKTAPEVAVGPSADLAVPRPDSSLGAQVAAQAAQLAALQASTTELQQQMVESSALIQSLAEQNTQLIARVELNRKRLLALAALTLVLGVVLGLHYF